MRTLFIRVIAVCQLASISPVTCEAQNVFSFSQGQSDFIQNIEILKDSSGNFTIDKAVKSDGFQLHTGGIPNLGVSSNTYW
ncbi:MAG: 7TM-DISM domain-containing protein, partial [Bacteroidota bacterium]